MTSSGTYNFALSNVSIIFEAFDRIGVDPETITTRQMISARNSLNLELLEFSNRGFNFWKLDSGTINLALNQATYTLPANLVTLTELWYSQVNAQGAGVNQDRLMIPISRGQYAQISNKLQPGIPTQYWFQMLTTPQVTIWMVPQAGQTAPTTVLNWYGLQQIQDANLNGLETPDIHYRATEALITGQTLRLCEKFGPKDPQARQGMMMEKKALRDVAWENFTRRDNEPGDIIIQPAVSVYARGML